jgi:hypothetical protein
VNERLDEEKGDRPADTEKEERPDDEASMQERACIRFCLKSSLGCDEKPPKPTFSQITRAPDDVRRNASLETS